MNIKNLLILVLLSLSFLSCKKAYRGTADMQGYLMYKCGSKDPLGNVTISFTSNGETILSGTTDAFGYFHIKGDYVHKVGGAQAYEPMLKIEYNGQNGGGFGSVKLMRNPPDKFNDTLYLNNSTQSVLIMDFDTEYFGSEYDTLRIEYIDVNSNSYLYNNYVGPFKKGEVIDTILTRTDSHVGYAYVLRYPSACIYTMNNTNFQYAGYPWVDGQPNNACGNFTDVYLKLD